MKEIEMKAWLHTPQERTRVRTYLQKHGTFLQAVTKSDTMFARSNADHFDFRLRKIEGRSIVTKKQYHMVDGIEQNEELEFEVSDADTFQQFLYQQGYEVFLRKEKIAEIFEVPLLFLEISSDSLPLSAETSKRAKNILPKNAKMTAEIITIPTLGDFLEVEILCEDPAQIPLARMNLDNLFQELGLKENIETTQYAVLLQDVRDRNNY